MSVSNKLSPHGLLLKRIITDRDSKLFTTLWSDFLSQISIDRKMSTNDYPEAVGQTASRNFTIVQYLRLCGHCNFIRVA